MRLINSSGDMVAYKMRVTNPQDYGLFLLTEGTGKLEFPFVRLPLSHTLSVSLSVH